MRREARAIFMLQYLHSQSSVRVRFDQDDLGVR